MTIQDKLRNFYGKMRGTDRQSLEDQKKLTLNLVSDGKLAGRLELLGYALIDMEAEKNPRRKAFKMNLLIKVVGLAWSEAGDNEADARAMTWWEILYKNAVDVAGTVDQEQDPKRRERALYLYRRFVEREIIPYGSIVLDFCFKGKHVTGEFVAVLHGAMQQAGINPVTGFYGTQITQEGEEQPQATEDQRMAQELFGKVPEEAQQLPEPSQLNPNEDEIGE